MNYRKTLSRRGFLKSTASWSLGSTVAVNSMGFWGLVNAPKVIANADDFRALVLVFLEGGNDSFNMIVPTGTTSLRSDYENGRRFLALPAEQLNTLNLRAKATLYDGSSAENFGLHPNCVNMAAMFNAGDLSVLCNTGNLIVPTDAPQFQDALVSLPPRLFSHADQQRQFQSEPSNPFQYGWGGRLAEMLADYNTDVSVSPLISVSGLNSFQVSRDSLINPYTMSRDGVISLAAFTGDRKAIVEAGMAGVDDSSHLMAQKYRSVFDSARTAEAIVTTTFQRANASGVDYDGIFNAAGLSTTRVARQLKTVAKMIGGRTYMSNRRPVYFVKMSGFDTHQNMLSDHATLMSELDAALQGFKTALQQQGDFDKVLTYVGSEFGRTFTPNGDDATSGTDHGWGGHALAMGGMVNGGRLFGTYPNLDLNNSLDPGRGRWIPTTSNSQCAALIAHWMGVPQSEVAQIFPSLANFSSPFDLASNLDFLQF